jgi:hypothetical protein
MSSIQARLMAPGKSQRLICQGKIRQRLILQQLIRQRSIRQRTIRQRRET